MSVTLRALAALSLALAIAACGQLTGAKEKGAPEAEGDAAAPAADAAAKPDEAGKPATPETAAAGAQPDKPD